MMRMTSTLSYKTMSLYNVGKSSNVSSSSIKKNVLNLTNVNKRVIEFEYAVRGAQAQRADQLQKILNSPEKDSLPFKAIIACNIGNPQQLGQKPITFYRQVAALTEYPDLMDKNGIENVFPADVIARAKELLDATGGSIGSYSHSQGVPLIRERVAAFISKRDGGLFVNPEHIFLTAGASPGVQTVLKTIISHPGVGIMIPIPQYPLYTASISLFGGTPIPYILDESQSWSITAPKLQETLDAAKKSNANLDPKVLCVINPGNPTGQCLNEETMKSMIEFCAQNHMVLLADEVYQENTYQKEKPFHSFRKILSGMEEYKDHVGLISFHSVSKGMIGECGRRGGYFECVNIESSIMDLFYKIASVSLCPPVQGQIMVELMVNPPQPGMPSYDLYTLQINDIYASLKRRAFKLADAFNDLEGVHCNLAEGALYLFPSIEFPQGVMDAAEAKSMQPDEFYCTELLNATGVCVVPGAGFGQAEGTFHMRSTFLPPEEKMDEFIERIKLFHSKFLNKHG